ncbi:hypothetical protein NPIL_517391, partial [Nephila pilipes]
PEGCHHGKSDGQKFRRGLCVESVVHYESGRSFARSLPSSAVVRLLLFRQLRTRQCGSEQLRLCQFGHGEDM